MNYKNQSAEVFLATTASEEFWDVSKPIVFLGEWCLLYERGKNWVSDINGRKMPSPYVIYNAAEDACKYVDNFYEKLLPLLGEKLNAIHNKNYTSRYWRILIGPWLQLYLSVVYDRFIHLKQATQRFPNFTTIGLSPTSFVVPKDTLDFACLLSEDLYNLQFYTKLLHALGKEFPCKEISIPLNPLYGTLLKNSLLRKSTSYVAKVFSDIGAKFFKTTLLKNSYFSKSVETRLIIRNIGKILPNWNQVMPCKEFNLNLKKRHVLRSIEIGQEELEQCLASMLYADIPQCFIEGFSSVEGEVNNNYPKNSNAIFSANGWYYDEVFKQWAAASAETGSLLLGTQHGGNYGCISNMPSEIHETTIVDQYYSWGWERTDCFAKVIAMPATKLVGRKVIGADNKKQGILWAATSSQRYLIQFPFLPEHFQEYLAWQIRFVRALPEDVIEDLRFRPHYENYAWGTVERMKDCIPDIKVESWGYPFQTSLENCRLYVCDHLSTTFAEALASNKPTVLFWNPQVNKLRAEAQPYFDLLRDCGILLDTPEAAASAVASVYDDVEEWWGGLERQKAVRSFCARFARTSPDAISLWSGELLRVSERQSCS